VLTEKGKFFLIEKVRRRGRREFDFRGRAFMWTTWKGRSGGLTKNGDAAVGGPGNNTAAWGRTGSFRGKEHVEEKKKKLL